MNVVDEKFKLLTDLMNNDEWQLVKKSEEIVTERKFLEGSDIACFRANGFVNAVPDDLFKYIWDIYHEESGIKKYDNTAIFYQVVGIPKDLVRICYQINNLGWPVWPRDMIYLQTVKTTKNGSKWIYMYSIESGDFPPKPEKYVRAFINISAFGIVPEENGCRVYRLAHVDPSGSIPASVVNSYAEKGGLVINDLRKQFK